MNEKMPDVQVMGKGRLQIGCKKRLNTSAHNHEIRNFEQEV